MSPFLTRLAQEWNIARTARERGELEARRAGYLARTGDFEAAKSDIAELRKTYADGRDGRISIWIMISEALILHFEKIDLAALDRLKRAQLLSRMLGDRGLEATSSAWKAHIEFEHSMFDAMFESLRTAIDTADLNNDDARARIANIVCKTATLCGHVGVARSQFQIGRAHALAEGDQASIEALQHNMAAFRLARLRSLVCLGEVHQSEIDAVRTEILTAKSLQNLTGIKALSVYIELCQARFLIIEGQFSRAVEALQLIRDAGPFPPASVTPDLIDLDIIYCLSSMGDVEIAFQSFNALNFTDLRKIDVDERLVVRWQQLRLAEIDSRFGDETSIASQFEAAVADYRSMISKLRSGIDSLSL